MGKGKGTGQSREGWKESKASIKTRLQADGRWGAFVCRREALKHLGVDADEAWQAASMEFAPLPPPAEPDPVPVETETKPAEVQQTISADCTQAEIGTEELAYPQVLEWVFNHLDMSEGDLGVVPCRGCYSMWKFASSSDRTREKFYDWWGKVRQKREEEDGSKGDSDADVIEVLDRAEAVLAEGRA